MAVPNTNTFTMKDVCNEIGVSYSGTTLAELFSLANDSGFDPLYKGNKNSLYNFRNYSEITGLHYTGKSLQVHESAKNLYISPNGNIIAYMEDDPTGGRRYIVTTHHLSNSYDLESVTNTYRYQLPNGGNSIFCYANNGRYIYAGGTTINYFQLNTPYNPSNGITFKSSLDIIRADGPGTTDPFYVNNPTNFKMFNSGSNYIMTGIMNRQDLAFAYTKMGMTVPYDISTSYYISHTTSSDSPLPGFFSSRAISIDGRYYYEYLDELEGFFNQSIIQYITPTPWSTSNISEQPYVEIQLLPDVYEHLSLQRSSDGNYLYLLAKSVADDIKRIWEIKMTGTNIL